MSNIVTLPISIKKGTQDQIITSSGNLLGELAYAADSRSIFIFDGFAWAYANGVQIGNLSERPSPGILGRLFYAEDASRLFTDLVSHWSEGFVEKSYVDNLVSTTSGNLVTQMAAGVTLSGVGGIYTTKSGNTWYISSQDQIFTMPSGHAVGHNFFSTSGTSVTHNLGTVDHFLTVVPAGTSAFNEYEIASVGNVYIQLGLNDDTVWNTGGAMADGIQFFWEASTSNTYSVLATSTQDLLTLSGSLISYFESLLVTVSGQVPIVSVSGVVFGGGEFYYGGSTITHNLGTIGHFVCVTPADIIDFDEITIASIGEVYVKKGTNQDVVYHTGGESVNGVKFDWEVVKYGLKMVE